MAGHSNFSDEKLPYFGGTKRRDTYHVSILNLVGDGFRHWRPFNVDVANLIAQPTHRLWGHWGAYTKEVMRLDCNCGNVRSILRAILPLLTLSISGCHSKKYSKEDEWVREHRPPKSKRGLLGLRALLEPPHGLVRRCPYHMTIS